MKYAFTYQGNSPIPQVILGIVFIVIGSIAVYGWRKARWALYGSLNYTAPKPRKASMIPRVGMLVVGMAMVFCGVYLLIRLLID